MSENNLTLGVTSFIFIVYVAFIILSLVVILNNGSFISNSNRYDRKFKFGYMSVDFQNFGQISLTTFITVIVPLIFLAFIVHFIPNFQNLKKKLTDLKSVTIAFVYTILFLLLFRCIPKSTLDKYYYIFVPLALLSASIVFYNAIKTDFLDTVNFNVDYERIKMITLITCIVAIITSYYTVDPANFFSTRLEYILLFAIAVIFMVLYVICLYGAPLQVFTKHKSDAEFTMHRAFTMHGYFAFASILILGFFILLSFLKVYQDVVISDSDILNNADIVTTFTSYSVFIFFLFSLVVTSFPFFQDALKIKDGSSIFLHYRRCLTNLFALISIGIMVLFLCVNLYTLAINPNSESITRILLNFVMFSLILYLIVSTAKSKPITDNLGNSDSAVLVKSIFAEPLRKMKEFVLNEYQITKKSHVLFLIGVVSVVLLVYLLQLFSKLLLSQGGKILLSNVVNTNVNTAVSTYEYMNSDEDYHYTYSISFWVYINSFNENDIHKNKYKSLLNYGGKPNILYNGSTNTLMVTMKDTDFDKESIHLENLEKHKNSIVVYRQKNFELQKWNNIIINYDGGTLDVFINNVLVKSIAGIVPYMSLDSLTVGETSGVNAGITSVLYFKKPLSAINMFYMYHLMKNKENPIV